jgi:hypothetical protein
MLGHRLHRFIIVTGLGFLLASCGSNDAQWQEYAKAKHMSEPETAAFLICAKQSQRNRPIFADKSGRSVMKSTPLEVCACQAKSIMSVFLEKEYKSYTTFAEYMGKEVKKNPPRWGKRLLRDGVNPAEAGKRLEKSLTACVSTYVAAHQDLDPPLLVPLPVKEDEAAAKTAS